MAVLRLRYSDWERGLDEVLRGVPEVALAFDVRPSRSKHCKGQGCADAGHRCPA